VSFGFLGGKKQQPKLPSDFLDGKSNTKVPFGFLGGLKTLRSFLPRGKTNNLSCPQIS
jgi:hypothetical protein